MHSSNAAQVDSRVLDDIIGSFGASMHAADDLLVHDGAETGRIPVEDDEYPLPQDGFELIRMEGAADDSNWENTA